MGFVGEVSRLGDAWVRPHDIDVLLEPDEDAVQALVDRVARVGFEARIDLHLGDGAPVHVQVTRQQALELELEPGQIIWLRPHRASAFAG
jgi:sulfate transport system ATP-binding protein